MTAEDLKRVDELIRNANGCISSVDFEADDDIQSRIMWWQASNAQSSLAIAMMLRDQVNRPVNVDYDVVSPRSTSGPRSAFDTLKYWSKPFNFTVASFGIVCDECGALDQRIVGFQHLPQCSSYGSKP